MLLARLCNRPVHSPPSKHCTSFTHLSLLQWKKKGLEVPQPEAIHALGYDSTALNTAFR